MQAGTFAEQYGPWAVVTGASSGIGAEFARQLGRRGLHVVLVARRQDRLVALGAEIHTGSGVMTLTAQVDLAASDCLERLQAEVGARQVGLLVNAAGFATTGPFLETALDRHLELLALNARATLQLTHHFAQPMRVRRRGGIIFMGSTVAYFPTPLWAQYAATKAYARFLGLALGEELRASGVDVLVVCPGFTQTEFLATAGVQPTGGLTAQTVVDQALRVLGHTSVTVPGRLNQLGVLLARIAPERFVVRAAGRLITHFRAP